MGSNDYYAISEEQGVNWDKFMTKLETSIVSVYGRYYFEFVKGELK